MSKRPFIVSLGLLLSLISAGALYAEDGDNDFKARRGTVRCGGSNFLRLSGTEVQFATYLFRNFSSTTPITVERLLFFDATGSVLFDSNSSGFPPFTNGVLGPVDQELDPNQSAQLDTVPLLPFLPETQRPIQLEISWSAPERVLPLDVTTIRLVRQRDPVTFLQGPERSRDHTDCKTISLRR